MKNFQPIFSAKTRKVSRRADQCITVNIMVSGTDETVSILNITVQS